MSKDSKKQNNEDTILNKENVERELLRESKLFQEISKFIWALIIY